MWVLLTSFSMFSNFYHLYLHNETCVAIAKLQWSISRNRTYPDLIMVIEVHVCWFLTWMHMCSQFCSLLSVSGVVSKVWGYSPISSEHVSLWWLFFNPHQTTPIKYRSLIKKSNRIRHAYLRQIKFRIYPNRGLASSLDCLHYGNEHEC